MQPATEPSEDTGPRTPGRGRPGARSRSAPAPATPGLAAPASSLVCGGCGATVGSLEPYPFRCPRSGDGGDHVLRRVLDLGRLEFPKDVGEQNPFIAWRSLLHAYHLASTQGMSDRVFVELVRRLDDEVARVDGHGFARTPFKPSPSLADRLGTPATVWVKDETGNVAGSHKARHLFGLLVHLEVARLLGLTEGPLRPLAIASCGNAALAAGVVAAAGGRQLLVFVPTDADPVVLGRLEQLGAEITVCPSCRWSRRRSRLSRLADRDRRRRAALHLPRRPERPRHRGCRDARLRDGGGAVRARSSGPRRRSGRWWRARERGGAVALRGSRARRPVPGSAVAHRADRERLAARQGVPPGFRRPPGPAGPGGDRRRRPLRRCSPLGVHVAMGDGASQPGSRDPRR